MLRNCAVAPSGHSAVALLNEVLSLNAQEFDHVAVNRPRIVVLNEVLSLNAQEFLNQSGRDIHVVILNEVLSLNAQESLGVSGFMAKIISSMKS